MKISTLGSGPGLTKTSGLSKSLPGEKRAPVLRDEHAEASPWLAVSGASKQMIDISVRMQQLENVTESNKRKVAMKTAVNDLETEIANNNDFISNPKAIAGFYRERMDSIRKKVLSGANKPVADHVGYAFDMHRTETDPRIDNQIRQGMIKNATDQMWKNIDASKALLLNTESDKSLQDTLDRVPGFVQDLRQQIDDGVRTGLINPEKAQPLFDATVSETTKSSYMQLIPEYPKAMNQLLNGAKKEEFLQNLSPANRTAVRNAARTAYKNFQSDNEGRNAAAALFKEYKGDAVAAYSAALNVGRWKDELSDDGYKTLVSITSAAATEHRRLLAEFKDAETQRFWAGQDQSKYTRTEQLANAVSAQRDPNNSVPIGIITNRIAVLTENKQRSPDGVDAAWAQYLATPEKERDLMKFRHAWSRMHFQDMQELENRVKANTKLEGGQVNYQQMEINNLNMKQMTPQEKRTFILKLGRAMKVTGLNAADQNVSKLAAQLHKGRAESDLAKMFDKLGSVGEAAKALYTKLGGTDRTLTQASPLYKTLERLDSQGDSDIADKLIRQAWDKDIPDATPGAREWVDSEIATKHNVAELGPEELDALQVKYYQDYHNAEILGEATNLPDIVETLPDGQKIEFNGNSHTYIAGGQELDSTTALLSGAGAFPEFPKREKAEEKAKRDNLTVEEVERMWEQNGFVAREWGNKYHKHAQAITGMISPDKAPMAGNEKEHAAFLGLEQHFDKVLGDGPDGGWKVIGQEQILANPKAKAAGTADLILEKDGVVKIVDLKTSKELEFPGAKIIHGRSVMAGLKNTKMQHYRAQLAMYKAYYLSQHPGAKVVTELWRSNDEGAVEVHDMNSKNMDIRVTGLLNGRLRAGGHQLIMPPKRAKRSFMPKVPKALFTKEDRLGPSARNQ